MGLNIWAAYRLAVSRKRGETEKEKKRNESRGQRGEMASLMRWFADPSRNPLAKWHLRAVDQSLRKYGLSLSLSLSPSLSLNRLDSCEPEICTCLMLLYRLFCVCICLFVYFCGIRFVLISCAVIRSAI